MDTQNAVNYHYEAFPPRNLRLDQLLGSLLKATDALARYDQVLKSLHSTEFFLAPLRNQEAVISYQFLRTDGYELNLLFDFVG